MYYQNVDVVKGGPRAQFGVLFAHDFSSFDYKMFVPGRAAGVLTWHQHAVN